MKIEGDVGFVVRRESVECLKMKKDNETVNSAKRLRVSNVVGSANDSEQ